MPETTGAGGSLPQAVDLAQLVELEAIWENMPQGPPQDVRGLAARQGAYEAYRSRRAAYNGLHEPAHDPKVLVHTPARLGAWLRAMRDLFARAEQDPRCPCPVHLLEKARRGAERAAVRLGKEPPALPGPPTTVRAAVEGLEALARWCEAAV